MACLMIFIEVLYSEKAFGFPGVLRHLKHPNTCCISLVPLRERASIFLEKAFENRSLSIQYT
jgi:hypothetical protein